MCLVGGMEVTEGKTLTEIDPLTSPFISVSFLTINECSVSNPHTHSHTHPLRILCSFSQFIWYLSLAATVNFSRPEITTRIPMEHPIPLNPPYQFFRGMLGCLRGKERD